MARYELVGKNANNLSAWVDSFDDMDGATKVRVQKQLIDEEIYDYKDDWNRLRSVNPKLANKIKSARYDWLFDDLQKFTTINADSIRSQNDLRRYIRDTIGRSPAYGDVDDEDYLRVENKLVKGFLESPVRDRIVNNVVKRLTIADIEDLNVTGKRKEVATRLISSEKLFLINRKQVVAKGTDKRGRTFYYRFKGRGRSKSPFDILRKAGF